MISKRGKRCFNERPKLDCSIKLNRYSSCRWKTEEEEQELLFSFVNAFGITDDEIQPYIDVLSVKNDLASFVE